MTRPMVLPLGVAVAKNSIVYVTSYGTSSIEVYALDGYVTVAVSDAALSFEARQYGPNPEIKSIMISNGGAGTLNWTATADKEWIALGQAAGTTAGGGATQLGIGVNISSLSAGVHTGIVTIASDFVDRYYRHYPCCPSPGDSVAEQRHAPIQREKGKQCLRRKLRSPSRTLLSALERNV
jgi:hypothetical protein